MHNSPTLPLEVLEITTPDELAEALALRKTVFVHEQQVPENLELDEWDTLHTPCKHFLAIWERTPVATLRIRPYGPEVYKLERCAVGKLLRGQGVGKALVQAVLKQLPAGSRVVLHAQADAIPFWAKLGFLGIGEAFEEAGIQHLKMVKAC